jgi:hypothetical protein
VEDATPPRRWLAPALALGSIAIAVIVGLVFAMRIDDPPQGTPTKILLIDAPAADVSLPD